MLFNREILDEIACMDNRDSSPGPVQITTPVRFSDELPPTADVVVVGAGVIGIFTALYLARAGFKVVVCEKGRVACEQSSRNWGWIRQHGRDRAELPIMMEASRLWEEADRDAGGRTGFRRQGVCYLASSEKKLVRRESWLEIAREHQLDTRMLTKSEIDGLIERKGNTGAHNWVGASFTPSDARAEAWQAIPAIAELAQSEGVQIRENCAVRGLDVSGGQVRGVKTEAGNIQSEQVIVAAGAWTSLFLRRHGINIPQLSVRSTVCKTGPMPEVFAGNAADEDLAFRRRMDGSYTLAGGARNDCYIGPDAFRHFFKYLPVASQHLPDITFRFSPPNGFPDSWGISRNWSKEEESPFEKMRVLNPEPNIKQIEAIRSLFAARFPELGKPQIEQAWAGMIDCMPDIVPIVDRVPEYEGLIIATGMSGHGFGIGPGFGKILSLLVQEKPVGHDISRFRFSRFSDGSKLKPGPSI
ncbi:MAG: NAD(P)/FAD-dependent oxidoreductase [Rhizobiaceae bacterium]